MRDGWLLIATVVCAMVVFDCGAPDPPRRPASVTDAVSPTWDFPEARQFDFWRGTWDVNLRVRQQDLSWEDRHHARAHVHRVLDGRAILELWSAEMIRGFSLRYFDRARDHWELWLAWPRPGGGSLSRLEGTFRHGRGEFFTTFPAADGSETLARYTFSDIGPNRLRWDDAYSKDGGRTWSPSWIMEFTRTGETAPWPENSTTAHSFGEGQRCTGGAFDRFVNWAGDWNGTVNLPGSSASSTIRLEARRILGGCGLLTRWVHDQPGAPHREIGFLGFDPQRAQVEFGTLDNAGPEGFLVHRGRLPEGANAPLTLVATTDDGGRRRWTIDLDSDRPTMTLERADADGPWSPVLDAKLER